MKKFLSLVLALVMTMSLVTISAGAKDFTDAADIDYKEAVAVMSELKIVDGTGDGTTFNPDGALTRGAAAKIICNLILGPTTAAALKADAAPFADVPANHTFAGYIAYCVQAGILDGYNDGTFRPSNPLTGYAFMKMLLGALGYDKDVEGFNGPNWSVSVAKLAISLGLDDGNNNFNGVATVTREEALLYAFNTMKATMVDYDTTTTVNVNGASVVIGGSKAEAVEDKAPEKNGYIATDAENDIYVQFCEKYFPKLELKDAETTDDFGRPANTWYNGKDKIGTFAKTPDLIYFDNQTAKTIYGDLDLAKAYDFEVVVDGKEVAGTGDFVVCKKDNQNNLGGTAKAKLSTADAGIGLGTQIEVYEDAKTIVAINTYLLKAADDYNEKKETLTLKVVTDAEGNDIINDQVYDTLVLSADDFAVEGFEKDDYVTVTVAYDGAKYDIKSIAACEPTVATATEYVHAESLTASGETYKYNVKNLDKAKAYSLKSDYNLYLDGQGNILYAEGVSVESKYVFIDEFSTSSNLNTNAKIVAYAYFTDGTADEIVVSKIAGEKVKAIHFTDPAVTTEKGVVANAGEWYTYTEKDGKYELKKVTLNETDTTKVGQAKGEVNTDTNPATDDYVTNYDDQHADIYYGAGTKQGTKNTVFVILKDNGDIVTYTGINNVPEIKGDSTDVYVVYKGSYVSYVFVKLDDGDLKGGANSSDLVFAYGVNTVHANDVDDVEYYRYKAIVNGETTTVKVLKTIDGADSFSGMLWTDIEYNAKNYIVDANDVDAAEFAAREDFTVKTAQNVTAAKVSISGQTLIINDYDYYMAEDFQIFVITDTTLSTAEVEEMSITELDTYGIEGVTTATIYGVLNEDGLYTTLYIAE